MSWLIAILIAAGVLVGALLFYRRIGGPALERERIRVAGSGRREGALASAWYWASRWTGRVRMALSAWLGGEGRRSLQWLRDHTSPAGIGHDAPAPVPDPPPGRPAPPLPPPPLPGASLPPVSTGAMPADHAAVQARIAGFEPENDADLLAFYDAEMAGAGGYAQAWEAHAEVLANAIGLDPAFTHVAAQLAESASELGHDFAMVRARLNQVYASVQQFVADGGVLPFEARRFLTGEGF